ncbi:MAG: ankyrin repeat domain-containing protein, partial [Candidatus Amoebophilus sp.]
MTYFRDKLVQKFIIRLLIASLSLQGCVGSNNSLIVKDEDKQIDDEQINQYKLDKLEEFRTLIMSIIETGSKEIKNTPSYVEWEKLARTRTNQKYKERKKFPKIEEEWAKGILLEQDLVKQGIIRITLSGVESYGKPEILTKTTIESDALPIFREPINIERGLEESYTIDGKVFRRQNVSGEGMRCFFNSIGLEAEEQINKLREYQNDPVVRYMIANEIVSAAKTPEQLPDEIKKEINYELYKQQIEPISAERVRVKGMRLLTTEELHNLNKQEETILQELRERACVVEAFNAFLDYHIGKRQMMVANHDVKGNNPENKDPNYTSIDAIAYINNLGIKIYQPTQTRNLDGNIRIVKGKLDLIHEFCAAKATRVVYLYHSGLHFQTLIPDNTTTVNNEMTVLEELLPIEIWCYILSFAKIPDLYPIRLANREFCAFSRVALEGVLKNLKAYIENNIEKPGRINWEYVLIEIEQLARLGLHEDKFGGIISDSLWTTILANVPNNRIKKFKEYNELFNRILREILKDRALNILRDETINSNDKRTEIDNLLELGLILDSDVCDYYGSELGGRTITMEPSSYYDPYTEEVIEEPNIDEIEDDLLQHLNTRTGYHKIRPRFRLSSFGGSFGGLKLIYNYPLEDYRILDPEKFSSLEDYHEFKVSTFNKQRNIFEQLKNKNSKVELNPEDIPQYLCWAAEEGDIELAKRLLEMGANIKVKDGQTLLHIAVKRRQLEFIKWLLSLGVKVSARDNLGNT